MGLRLRNGDPRKSPAVALGAERNGVPLAGIEPSKAQLVQGTRSGSGETTSVLVVAAATSTFRRNKPRARRQHSCLTLYGGLDGFGGVCEAILQHRTFGRWQHEKVPPWSSWRRVELW